MVTKAQQYVEGPNVGSSRPQFKNLATVNSLGYLTLDKSVLSPDEAQEFKQWLIDTFIEKTPVRPAKFDWADNIAPGYEAITRDGHKATFLKARGGMYVWKVQLTNESHITVPFLHNPTDYVPGLRHHLDIVGPWEIKE